MKTGSNAPQYNTYKVKMKLQPELRTFVVSYERNYDAHDWFMQNTKITKVLPYSESIHSYILSLVMRVPSLKFFPDSVLGCCIIREVIKINAKRYVIVTKDIPCQSYSATINNSISAYLV